MTSWLGVAVIGGFVVVSVCGVWGVTVWQARKFQAFERRLSDPQRGAATGTGVEQQPSRKAADAGVLPRSPMAPVGVVFPRRATPTGLQPGRVQVHG